MIPSRFIFSFSAIRANSIATGNRANPVETSAAGSEIAVPIAPIIDNDFLLIYLTGAFFCRWTIYQLVHYIFIQ
jgi:hypothetical protein